MSAQPAPSQSNAELHDALRLAQIEKALTTKLEDLPACLREKIESDVRTELGTNPPEEEDDLEETVQDAIDYAKEKIIKGRVEESKLGELFQEEIDLDAIYRLTLNAVTSIMDENYTLVYVFSNEGFSQEIDGVETQGVRTYDWEFRTWQNEQPPEKINEVLERAFSLEYSSFRRNWSHIF